ncbi:sensor domain-containing diguanylate cyclase [Pseudomonas iranensis]|jgi:diguanylate cyclase (GGDEF)-like protein|uniref:sensor domain-containing diguanylate cyclase n=1 Tax=Pseudomonas iranensis TaxID=2745503 RepID=UPI001648CF44|nr:sensor domain-containing diguanylate cyclase [Pseudomonas iranensis]QXI20127.1 sensor domain-containing diguanylate cyclase [Pseudomonas iranensis]
MTLSLPIYARLTPRALSLSLIGFVLLVCLSLILATAWQIVQSSGERVDAAKITVSNIVLAAEQQARDTMLQADNTLRDLAERVAHDGSGPDQQERLAKLMARQVNDIEGVQGLFIFDAQGNWMANSFSEGLQTKNNGDRAYFRYHREHDDQSIHVGSIVESRTTGDMVIPISRRIQTADGAFAGVALATVPVSYFQSFFKRMAVDDEGVIFLALDNGELLARRPTVAALMTTNLSKGEIFSRYLPESDSGTAVIKSIVDGIERIYAYRRLAGLPIVAAAGVSYEHVFAPWWSYVYQSVALVGSIILALAILGSLLYRQIQQLLVAEYELKIIRKELEVIAHTDGLTSLANRRSFDLAMDKEWKRATRNQTSISVILLDIDLFKQYNDHYGHLSGDECLVRVASVIAANVNRPGDFAARYGGEEFIVLLPETELAGAVMVAENIRLSLLNANIQHLASPFGIVTISSGVVSTSGTLGESPKEFLIKADQLLYAAKSQGRNRVGS